MNPGKTSVVVLYNHVGKDEYVALRSVDPSSLDFKPSYDIHVATVQEEYDAIVSALCAEGFQACGMNIQDDASRLYRQVSKNPPDVVFNLVEYFHDDQLYESSVAGFLDLFGIAYTGATALCLALCGRKVLTKQVLLQNGVSTPRFRSLDYPKISRRHGLQYPLMVKPSRQDASTGVEEGSVVYDYAQLMRQLESIFERFRPPILVEEFIEGRELHVSVLGNNPPQVLPVLEYDFSELQDPHPPVITYDAKWNPLSPAFHRVHSLCPARLDSRSEKRIRRQALLAYTATLCRDYARIDFRMGSDGVPHVLEVNPNPDLTEGVSFMECAEKAGMGFAETLRRIVGFALERQKASAPKTEAAGRQQEGG
jgi:D-alanine-D-alanine ligase